MQQRKIVVVGILNFGRIDAKLLEIARTERVDGRTAIDLHVGADVEFVADEESTFAIVFRLRNVGDAITMIFLNIGDFY